MRALYAFLVGSLLTPLVWAQAINVTNQGVGLNTSNPEAKWDIYAGTLGTAPGNTFNFVSLSSHSANHDRLQMKSVREANGASWETAAFVLQRKVDVTDMGYVKFTGRDLALGSGPVEAARIQENGRVGLGLSNNYAIEAKKKKKNGTAVIDATNFQNSEALDWPNTALIVKRHDDYNHMRMLSFAHVGDSNYQTGEGVWGFKLFDNVGGKAVSDANTHLWLGGPGNFLVATGNVGIGTVAATHRLTVAGQVKATGYVTGSVAWADHVFAEDYNLAPLGEVEAHIKEKRHLPGIPSAAEVKAAGGVELGDMQVKLLAKVEELTLHLIALEKQVRSQQARIAELEGGKL